MYIMRKLIRILSLIILLCPSLVCTGDAVIHRLMIDAAQKFPHDRIAQEDQVKAQLCAYIDLVYFLRSPPAATAEIINISDQIEQEYPYNFILQRTIFYEMLKAYYRST